MLEGFHPAKELRHHAGSREEEGRERGVPEMLRGFLTASPTKSSGWVDFFGFYLSGKVDIRIVVDPNHFLTPDIYSSQSLWTQMRGGGGGGEKRKRAEEKEQHPFGVR